MLGSLRSKAEDLLADDEEKANAGEAAGGKGAAKKKKGSLKGGRGKGRGKKGKGKGKKGDRPPGLDSPKTRKEFDLSLGCYSDGGDDDDDLASLFGEDASTTASTFRQSDRNSPAGRIRMGMSSS